MVQLYCCNWMHYKPLHFLDTIISLYLFKRAADYLGGLKFYQIKGSIPDPNMKNYLFALSLSSWWERETISVELMNYSSAPTNQSIVDTIL